MESEAIRARYHGYQRPQGKRVEENENLQDCWRTLQVNPHQKGSSPKRYNTVEATGRR